MSTIKSTYDVIKNIEFVSNGAIMFGMRRIGECRFTFDIYKEGEVVMGTFPYASSINLGYPYDTIFFHKNRLWQFEISKFCFIMNNNIIPYSWTNIPIEDTELKIPRSDGSFSLGQIHPCNKAMRLNRDGDDFVVRVLFEVEKYKDIYLTDLIKLNKEKFDSLVFSPSSITKTCKETDMEKKYSEEIYKYYNAEFDEWKIKIHKIMSSIATETGIIMDVDPTFY